KTHFSDEETAAETKTVLLMHTGGVDPVTSKSLGTHGIHAASGAEIRYAADPGRREVSYVRYRAPDGKVVEYFAKDAKAPTDGDALPRMACMHCHNRPAPSFELPAAAVDTALAGHMLDRTLPFIRKRSLEVLQQGSYASQAEAAAGIRAGLRDFYA